MGPITATALVVAIGGLGRFRSGRRLAAHLGLVPKQRSSGGQERLGTISKRGGASARTLLAHGARAVARWRMRARLEPHEGWMGRLRQRRPVNVAVIAQANNTARIVWALLSQGRIAGARRPRPPERPSRGRELQGRRTA
jgi:transposase